MQTMSDDATSYAIATAAPLVGSAFQAAANGLVARKLFTLLTVLLEDHWGVIETTVRGAFVHLGVALAVAIAITVTLVLIRRRRQR